MSPLQDTDVLGISRNDPQTAGTYKVTLGDFKTFIGTPIGAVKPDWNAAPSAPAGILNRPDAATSTTQGLMSGADKAKLDQLTPGAYVAKAGDTMTGELIVKVAKGGGYLAVKDSTDPSVSGGLGLDAQNRAILYGQQGITIGTDNNAAISIAPNWDRAYQFEGSAASFYRRLRIIPGDAPGVPCLQVAAKADHHAVIQITNPGETAQWAIIDAQDFRTDYAGRKEVWIRSSQEDSNGFVQLHGGGNSGTPIVFSAGAESRRIADIDQGGQWHAVSDRKMKTAVRGIALGLEAVLKMRPCSFRYKEEVDSKSGNAPERLGFIAQEMEEVVPEAVKVNEDGLYTMAPSLLIPVLVKAIQELTARVEQLEGAV